MDVLPGAEALEHGLVLRHVGQEAQLDLGVVRVHQNVARGGHEHIPELGPQLGADGDILQVWLGGAEPPGRRDGVLKAGVDAAVGGDDLIQAVYIGGLELGQLAVFQNGLDDGVLAPELFQHLRVGGVAGFGLLHRGQAQLLKEDAPQLLGGVEVEGILPRQVIDGVLDLVDSGGQLVAEGVERPPVDEEAHVLHLGQNGAEGEVHGLVEAGHAQLLQPGGQHRGEGGDEGAVGHHCPGGHPQIGQRAEGPVGQIVGGLGELVVEIGQAQLFQVVAAVGGGQEIGGHLRVEDEAAGGDALGQEGAGQLLGPVGQLFDVRGEQLAQRVVVAL